LPMPKMTDELAADEDPLDGTEREAPLEMHFEDASVQKPDTE
jgi:segregation and condensation protein B